MNRGQIEVRMRTFQVPLVTQSGEIESLHMETTRLQAIPQCARGDTSASFVPARIADAVAVLQRERIQDVLRSLVVALMHI